MDKSGPISDQALRVMLVAGEASGDRHAADLYIELAQRIPRLDGFGMGGAKMRQAGVELEYDSSEIAVIGLDGLIRQYSKIRQALKCMRRLIDERNPELLICVDYKEFNFKLAQYAKSRGVQVLFYVSPQIWAWRPGRVKKYGRAVDHMAVIFPFEVPFYEAQDIPVTFVGHPLTDKVHATASKQKILAELGLDTNNPVVGLLPGSRRAEVKRMLPVMVDSTKILRQHVPGIQFVIVHAESIQEDQIFEILNPVATDFRIVRNRMYDAIQCCDAVVTVSGTATLEVALIGIPMVITYKVTALTYWIGRMLINIPYIGLPNIILGKKVVQELIQQAATPAAIADEILKILNDADYRAEISMNLTRVKEKLGVGGGIKRLAEIAVKMLREAAK